MGSVVEDVPADRAAKSLVVQHEIPHHIGNPGALPLSFRGPRLRGVVGRDTRSGGPDRIGRGTEVVGGDVGHRDGLAGGQRRVLRRIGLVPPGGVLLVAGDDHGAYSSTLPNQSDHLFAASMIPMLYPQSVEEYIELGLHGFAMSRYAGLPVGFKALADTVESSSSIAAW